MSPERWLQIKDVLETVLERPFSERGALLNKSCGADSELLGEIESLLFFEKSADKDIFEENQLPFAFDGETKEDSNGFVGKQIGKYRIVRELGAGGMGVVYLAERADADFEQKVAVKFLRHFSSTSALQRFLLERRILARLHHQFIAQLIDGGTTSEGTPYLVMEYIEGSPITRYSEKQNLNLEDRIALFCKICSAVSFAHRNSIVHRDLKPDNILITDEGIPKLLDFGIAKLLSESEVKATVTHQQAFTPEYASPEQIKGETITTASDVYVLGVILYELLTGKRPYQLETINNHKEIWHVVNRSEPLKPSGTAGQFKIRDSKFKNKAVPQNFTLPNSKLLKGDLDNIVLKALKGEPARRYASVEELTEDLRRYQEGLPVKARPDTFFYRASKFAARQRWAIVAAGLVFTSLLIGLIGTLQQAQRAERERKRAEQRAENLRNISKSVVFDVHNAIRNLPGSLNAREILLERAIEQLQILAADARDNPDLQDELAQAYFNVGEMQQAAGNIAESEESHRRAVSIYQKLASENPQNPNYSRGLARGYGFLANVAYLRGETGKSSELYALAPPILEQLNSENPDNSQNLNDLWNAYANYATSLSKLGQASDSLLVSEKALQIAEQLNLLDGSSADNRQVLYLSKSLIAVSWCVSGNYQKSIVILKEIISEAEKIHAEFPDDTRFQYDLWAFYRRIGIAQDKTGNAADATENLKKSLAVIQDLMKSSPKDVGYKRNSSITLLSLGESLLHQKESKKAAVFLLDSREISEKLLKNDPENGETIADLALIYGNLAVAFAETREFEKSSAYQNKALDFFDNSLSKSPENNSLKSDFAKILDKTAETYASAAERQNFEQKKALTERANFLFEQSRRIGKN